MRYPQQLTKLITLFKSLPGIGTRSAERLAFQLLEWPHEKVQQFAAALTDVKETLQKCPECGAWMEDKGCAFCLSKRDPLLCIVSHPKDIFLFEATRHFRGFYHVFTSTGATHGKQFDLTSLAKLKTRIPSLSIKEVILAFDATLEGDAASHFLKKELSPLNIPLSRLAFGLPIGSSFDLIDGGTLARSLSGRHHL